VQTNHQGGGEPVQAVAAVLSDLRNESGLSAAWGPKQAEKPLLFETPWAVTQPGDVVVGDRA
jgi:hypothetical protein